VIYYQWRGWFWWVLYCFVCLLTYKGTFLLCCFPRILVLSECYWFCTLVETIFSCVGGVIHNSWWKYDIWIRDTAIVIALTWGETLFVNFLQSFIVFEWSFFINDTLAIEIMKFEYIMMLFMWIILIIIVISK
jgi:hypothetical protein